MCQLTLDTYVQRNDAIIAADMGGELGMLNEENGMYYALGSTGSRVWNLIEGKIRIETIVDKLVSEYDVDKETCAKDVIEFIQKMVSSKLIITS